MKGYCPACGVPIFSIKEACKRENQICHLCDDVSCCDNTSQGTDLNEEVGWCVRCGVVQWKVERRDLWLDKDNQ